MVQSVFELSQLPSTVATLQNIIGKNAIINGNFLVWQRGTSFSSVATNTNCADRFKYIKTGAMVHNISQSSDIPTLGQAGVLLQNSMLVDCITVDSSIAAGDSCTINHYIEGYNFVNLAQKSLTLSFFVKATKTGTYCVSLRNQTDDKSYVAEYTVDSSNTWEQKTIPISATPSSGTWNYTDGVGLGLSFVLAAGSNLQTTKDVWQTGAYLATSNQVNACDNTANNFYLTAIKLEVGSVATKFENPTIQEQIEDCQRYFKKSYNINVTPGSITNAGAVFCNTIGTQNGLRVYIGGLSQRTASSITLYNPNSGGAGSWRNNTLSNNLNVGATGVGMGSFCVIDVGATIDACDITGHWVADCEF